MKKARSIRRGLLPPAGDPEAAPADRSRTARAGGLLMTPAEGWPGRRPAPSGETCCRRLATRKRRRRTGAGPRGLAGSS